MENFPLSATVGRAMGGDKDTPNMASRPLSKLYGVLILQEWNLLEKELIAQFISFWGLKCMSSVRLHFLVWNPLATLK